MRKNTPTCNFQHQGRYSLRKYDVVSNRVVSLINMKTNKIMIWCKWKVSWIRYQRCEQTKWSGLISNRIVEKSIIYGGLSIKTSNFQKRNTMCWHYYLTRINIDLFATLVIPWIKTFFRNMSLGWCYSPTP